MIETSFVIGFIVFSVGMGTALAADKNKGIRSFILLIGILIVVSGTAMVIHSGSKDRYLGKPATIENLAADKDFWISKILKKDLLEITDLETGKTVIVKDLPIENPVLGKNYFIAKIKNEKVVLPSKK